jgi:TM2 domain-containing membrane protein YozV
MYCRNCGQPVIPNAVACMACGAAPLAGRKHCQNCAAETDPAAYVCVKCGVKLAQGPLPGAKSRLAAGLLGILLGGLGIQRFYLGHTGLGIAQLLVTFVTCGIGAIWGFIDGIVILAGGVNHDADGVPLGP